MRLIDMGQQQLKKRPSLAPVLEDHALDKQQQPSTVRYKAHKYGSAPSQCTCVSLRFSFFGRLRDRYIRAMNEMAMGGDFTAVTGYHGWGLEHGYNLQRCNIADDRHVDALQEHSITISRSQRQSQL